MGLSTNTNFYTLKLERIGGVNHELGALATPDNPGNIQENMAGLVGFVDSATIKNAHYDGVGNFLPILPFLVIGLWLVTHVAV